MMDAVHIYETLLGERLDPHPGIGNAFAEGMQCAKLYSQIYAARERLCDRLNAEEDPDVEIILDSFFEINRVLCLKMFCYGQQHPTQQDGADSIPSPAERS